MNDKINENGFVMTDLKNVKQNSQQAITIYPCLILNICSNK